MILLSFLQFGDDERWIHWAASCKWTQSLVLSVNLKNPSVHVLLEETLSPIGPWESWFTNSRIQVMFWAHCFVDECFWRGKGNVYGEHISLPKESQLIKHSRNGGGVAGGVPFSTVWKILIPCAFHLFEVQDLQSLAEDNPNCCLEMCLCCLDLLDRKPAFLKTVSFYVKREENK